jgi:hypothetical protein
MHEIVQMQPPEGRKTGSAFHPLDFFHVKLIVSDLISLKKGNVWNGSEVSTSGPFRFCALPLLSRWRRQTMRNKEKTDG